MVIWIIDWFLNILTVYSIAFLIIFPIYININDNLLKLKHYKYITVILIILLIIGILFKKQIDMLP